MTAVGPAEERSGARPEPIDTGQERNQHERDGVEDVSTRDPEPLGWKTYAKVTGIAVVALVVLVVGSLATIAGEPGDLGIWPVVAIAVCPVGLASGYRELRKWQAIRETPTSPAGSLAPGEVEVKGRATPVDEPLTAPLTHADACVYEVEVEAEHHGSDGSEWKTALAMRDETPFIVDDGTGRVRVDPAEASLSVEREQRIHVEVGEDPPSELGDWAVQQGHLSREELEAAAEEESGFLDQIGELFDGSDSQVRQHFVETSWANRRYTEWVLGVDEEAYVLGHARPRDGGSSAGDAADLVIRGGDASGRFVVSDKSESELVDDKLVKAAFGLSIGIVGTGLGLLGVLRMTGLL